VTDWFAPWREWEQLDPLGAWLAYCEALDEIGAENAAKRDADVAAGLLAEAS
jgi:hypothetical protein